MCFTRPEYIFSLFVGSSPTMIVVVYLILFPSQSIVKYFLTLRENWNNYHQSASSWSNKSWQSINRKLKIVQHWTDCQFSTKQVIFVNTNNIVEFSMLTFALWSHVVDTLKLSTGLNKFHNFNFFVGRPDWCARSIIKPVTFTTVFYSSLALRTIIKTILLQHLPVLHTLNITFSN